MWQTDIWGDRFQAAPNHTRQCGWRGGRYNRQSCLHLPLKGKWARGSVWQRRGTPNLASVVGLRDPPWGQGWRWGDGGSPSRVIAMETGTGVASGCILRREPPEFAERRGCGRKRGTKDASENSGLSRRRAQGSGEAGVEGMGSVMSRRAPASVGCSQCSACAHRFTDAPQHPQEVGAVTSPLCRWRQQGGSLLRVTWG